MEKWIMPIGILCHVIETEGSWKRWESRMKMVVGGHELTMKRSEEGEVKSYQPSALGSSGQRKFKREKWE